MHGQPHITFTEDNIYDKMLSKMCIKLTYSKQLTKHCQNVLNIELLYMFYSYSQTCVDVAKRRLCQRWHLPSIVFTCCKVVN